VTRAQLVVKIRENLNDHFTSTTYYNVDDLNDSIQDGYDEVVAVSECYERVIDVPVGMLNAQPWVNFRGIIPDYYRIVAILNRNTREFLCADGDREEECYKADWQLTSTGRVQNYVINGTEWIALPNWYSDSSYKDLRVFYKALAPKPIDDNHVFKILTEYQKLLENYSTADLLEQNQEFVKAQNYWAVYEPMLEEYRRKILLLSKSDRIFTREGYGY
jgi:hypothetical protein